MSLTLTIAKEHRYLYIMEPLNKSPLAGDDVIGHRKDILIW